LRRRRAYLQNGQAPWWQRKRLLRLLDGCYGQRHVAWRNKKAGSTAQGGNVASNKTALHAMRLAKPGFDNDFRANASGVALGDCNQRIHSWP
jgi:hypothetical protein